MILSAVEEEWKSILQEHPDLKGVITSSDYIAHSCVKGNPGTWT